MFHILLMKNKLYQQNPRHLKRMYILHTILAINITTNKNIKHHIKQKMPIKTAERNGTILQKRLNYFIFTHNFKKYRANLYVTSQTTKNIIYQL